MTCVKVPAGAPGTTIQVPHPKDKSQFISVSVPASAKAGQAMMVPVPPLEEACAGTVAHEGSEPSAPPPPAAAAATAAKPGKEKKGWSTGAKVAAGTAGAVAVGGLVVGGAILGEHIAEEGWDATVDDLGDWAADAGEWTVGAAETVGEGIADGAEAAVDWIGGAAGTGGGCPSWTRRARARLQYRAGVARRMCTFADSSFSPAPPPTPHPSARHTLVLRGWECTIFSGGKADTARASHRHGVMYIKHTEH